MVARGQPDQACARYPADDPGLHRGKGAGNAQELPGVERPVGDSKVHNGYPLLRSQLRQVVNTRFNYAITRKFKYTYYGFCT